MILTKQEILKEIKNKNITIVPFSKKNIGPASIDLTLDNKFRLFKNPKIIPIAEKTDNKKYTKLVTKNKIILYPNEFIIGITKEKINLPNNICGWLTGRSRFARLGLQIHSTAAFMNPGINNKQVLEIYNLSPNPLELKPGTKICQLIFEKTEGKAKYKGKFKSQSL